MQCWRCKQYGHRTGDRECPLNESGNLENEAARRMLEDPLASFKGAAKAEEKLAKKRKKLEMLQDLLGEVDRDLAEKKKKKQKKDKKKKEKKDKKKKKKEKKKKKKKSSSSSASSSGSDSD